MPGFKSLQICPNGSYTCITSVRYTVSNPVDSIYVRNNRFSFDFPPKLQVVLSIKKDKENESAIITVSDTGHPSVELHCCRGQAWQQATIGNETSTCLTFFGGELYLELFQSSFPARDPPFSRVGFALKTKQPVNTGVFKYMAKPAKGRTSTRLPQADHD